MSNLRFIRAAAEPWSIAMERYLGASYKAFPHLAGDDLCVRVERGGVRVLGQKRHLSPVTQKELREMFAATEAFHEVRGFYLARTQELFLYDVRVFAGNDIRQETYTQRCRFLPRIVPLSNRVKPLPQLRSITECEDLLASQDPFVKGFFLVPEEPALPNRTLQPRAASFANTRKTFN